MEEVTHCPYDGLPYRESKETVRGERGMTDTAVTMHSVTVWKCRKGHKREGVSG